VLEMALNGVHVACGFAGTTNFAEPDVPILGECVWSQTMASAGTTSREAPPSRLAQSEAIFSVDTSIDIFFAVGETPDATNGPRRFLRAGDHADVYATFRQKFAWVAA
jgi:hypothetical protein